MLDDARVHSITPQRALNPSPHHLCITAIPSPAGQVPSIPHNTPFSFHPLSCKDESSLNFPKYHSKQHRITQRNSFLIPKHPPTPQPHTHIPSSSPRTSSSATPAGPGKEEEVAQTSPGEPKPPLVSVSINTGQDSSSKGPEPPRAATAPVDSESPNEQRLLWAGYVLCPPHRPHPQPLLLGEQESAQARPREAPIVWVLGAGGNYYGGNMVRAEMGGRAGRRHGKPSQPKCC